MLSWEAANTIFVDFGVNPDLPHSRDKHSNDYTTEVVHKLRDIWQF